MVIEDDIYEVSSLEEFLRTPTFHYEMVDNMREIEPYLEAK